MSFKVYPTYICSERICFLKQHILEIIYEGLARSIADVDVFINVFIFDFGFMGFGKSPFCVVMIRIQRQVLLTFYKHSRSLFIIQTLCIYAFSRRVLYNHLPSSTKAAKEPQSHRLRSLYICTLSPCPCYPHVIVHRSCT